MGQSLPPLVYFCPFLITNSMIQIEQSVYGEHGIRNTGWKAQTNPQSYSGPHEIYYIFDDQTYPQKVVHSKCYNNLA